MDAAGRLATFFRPVEFDPDRDVLLLDLSPDLPRADVIAFFDVLRRVAARWPGSTRIVLRTRGGEVDLGFGVADDEPEARAALHELAVAFDSVSGARLPA